RLDFVTEFGELLALFLVLGARVFHALVGDGLHRTHFRGARSLQVGDLLANGLLGHFRFLGFVMVIGCVWRVGACFFSRTGPRLAAFLGLPESPGGVLSPASPSCPDAGRCCWSTDLIAVMTASEL